MPLALQSAALGALRAGAMARVSLRSSPAHRDCPAIGVEASLHPTDETQDQET